MGLSFIQALIIIGVILIFFGAKRIPLLGKAISEFMVSLKKGKDGSGDIDITEISKRNKVTDQKNKNS